MTEPPCLSQMKPGQTARILELPSAGNIRRRLRDLGFIEGTFVQCVGKSPSGDPLAFRIRGSVIAVRAADGDNIQIVF